jgi:TP901-1 family phage major tail protein
MAQGFSDRKVLIKIGDAASPETFATIAALRDVTITENFETVDTTTKDDSGVRTLLSDKTLQSTSVSGTGVFTDDSSIDDFRTAARAGVLKNFQLDIIDTDASTAGEVLEGAFYITQFEVSAANADVVNYNITLESSGALTSS